jgi:hypothetical protein
MHYGPIDIVKWPTPRRPGPAPGSTQSPFCFITERKTQSSQAGNPKTCSYL